MIKKPTKFIFLVKHKLFATLDLPCAFLGWIVRLLFPFFAWNLQVMARRTVEDILEKVWRNSGNEEDDFDDEWADESDKIISMNLKPQIMMFQVLQKRNQNQMRMILMKTGQIMPKMALLQSHRERRGRKSQSGNEWDLIYHHSILWWTWNPSKHWGIWTNWLFQVIFQWWSHELSCYWNRFAEQFIKDNNLKRRSRTHEWHPTEPKKMKQFLGPTFLMGIIQKPTIQMSWSNDPLHTHPSSNKWWKETGIHWFSTSCTSMTMTKYLENPSQTLTSCSKFNHWFITYLRNSKKSTHQAEMFVLTNLIYFAKADCVSNNIIHWTDPGLG